MPATPDSKDDAIACAVKRGFGVLHIQNTLHCDWKRIHRVAKERGLKIQSVRAKLEKPPFVRQGINYAAFAAHLRW